MVLQQIQDVVEDERVIRRAAQDQDLADTIREVRRMILKLGELPEAATLMSQHGYDQSGLQVGLDLYQAAFDSFDARSDAMARKQHASAALKGSELVAREVYEDFRTVTRPMFPGEADRTALGISGNTPSSRNAFIIHARDGYTSASRSPYAEVLSIYGFGPEVLKDALSTLDDLERADAVYRAAYDLAIASTTKRDQAGVKLQEWMRTFEGVLKVVLKGRPSLAEILGPGS